MSSSVSWNVFMCFFRSWERYPAYFYYTTTIMVSGGGYVPTEGGGYLYNPNKMFSDELNRRIDRGNSVVVDTYCFDPYLSVLPVPRRIYSVLKFTSDTLCSALFKSNRRIGKSWTNSNSVSNIVCILASKVVTLAMKEGPVGTIPKPNQYEKSSWDSAEELMFL